jgi:quercetin dioxygenase-like cupin family protein
MGKSIFHTFENGQVTANGETEDLSPQPWNPHKDFEGVYLKNVVTGDKTGGAFTCHLVRIAPDKKIGMHAHPTSTELHEVIDGDGKCVTEQGDVPYAPGSIAILAANSPHEVHAGEQGLCLFAKFINIQR